MNNIIITNSAPGKFLVGSSSGSKLIISGSVPISDSTILATVTNSLPYISRDNGITWSQVTIPNWTYGDTNHAWKGDNIWWITSYTSGKIYYSIDDAYTWNIFNTQYSKNHPGVVVKNGQSVFHGSAWVSNTDLKYSLNGGSNWSTLNLDSHAAATVLGIGVSKDGEHVTTAGKGWDVCWSTNDGGSTWRKNTFISNDGGGQIRMNATGQYQLYSAGSWTLGMWLSTDYGVTWSTNLDPNEQRTIRRISDDGKYISWARRISNYYTDCYLSSDYGSTFNIINDKGYVWYNSDDYEVIINRDQNGYAWLSTNRGQTTNQISNGVATKCWMDPYNKDVMILEDDDGLKTSLDRGATWNPSSFPNPNNLYNLHFTYF